MVMSRRAGVEPAKWGRGRLAEKGASAIPKRNYLLNGGMHHWQQGAVIVGSAGFGPVNDDGALTSDMWRFLVDEDGPGNDKWDISQDETTKPAASFSSLKLTCVATGPSAQCGISQILEERDAAELISEGAGICSLSFEAASPSAQIANLRAGIYTSTAGDAACKKLVIADAGWAGTAGTDPTPNSWTRKDTADVDHALNADNSFTTYKIEGVLLDTASTTNVAVVIWVDDVDASSGDIVNIGHVKLEPGAVATEFRHVQFGIEDQSIKRHFQQITPGAADEYFLHGHASSTSVGNFFLHYTEKRNIPAVTSEVFTAFGTTELTDSGDADVLGTSIAFANATVYGCTVKVVSTFAATNDGIFLRREGSSTAWIRIDATVGT